MCKQLQTWKYRKLRNINATPLKNPIRSRIQNILKPSLPPNNIGSLPSRFCKTKRITPSANISTRSSHQQSVDISFTFTIFHFHNISHLLSKNIKQNYAHSLLFQTFSNIQGTKFCQILLAQRTFQFASLPKGRPQRLRCTDWQAAIKREQGGPATIAPPTNNLDWLQLAKQMTAYAYYPLLIPKYP